VEFTELFRTGAKYIESSSESPVRELDIKEIAKALSNMLTHKEVHLISALYDRALKKRVG